MMPFEYWWKANAEKYLKDIDLLQEGCFSHCENFKITDTASDLVDQIYNQPDTDMLNTTMIFIQYLYEKYHLEPMDCELLGQLIIIGMHRQMKATADSICETLIGEGFDVETAIQQADDQMNGDKIIDITDKLPPQD